MKIFVQLLHEKKCLQTTEPDFVLDPITIMTDKNGRTYITGDDPRPYTLQMTWCGYDITGFGTVKAVAATMPEPTWGWRFRAKAALGYLPVEAFAEDDAAKGIDAGLLLEPFYVQWVNLNGYVGVRSVGAGLGFDLTRNFGAYAGYAFSWAGQRHNPHAAIYFSFW